MADLLLAETRASVESVAYVASYSTLENNKWPNITGTGIESRYCKKNYQSCRSDKRRWQFNGY